METDTLNKLTRAMELTSKRTKGRTEYIYFIFLTLLWCFVTWNSGTLQYMWSILMAKVNTMLFSVGFNHSYYRMTCNFCPATTTYSAHYSKASWLKRPLKWPASHLSDRQPTCSANSKENIKALFCGWPHLSPTDSPIKRPVMRKALQILSLSCCYLLHLVVDANFNGPLQAYSWIPPPVWLI